MWVEIAGITRPAGSPAGRILITADFVVDETFTLIRFRLGLAAAEGAWQQIDRSPRLRWERTGNERKIQRVSLVRFGASAATIRRLRRFRRSLAVLEAKAHPTRASVSTHLGCSDLAHLCRECREFAGTDIGALLSEHHGVETFKRRASPVRVTSADAHDSGRCGTLFLQRLELASIGTRNAP